MDLPRSWRGAASGPVIVLGNSLGTLQDSWLEVVAAIGDRARILTFDLPGHTRVEDRAFGFDDVATSAAAMLDAEGVRDALWCGVSLGGALGVAVAASRPDLVGGLVMVNSPIRQSSPDFWRARADTVERDGLAALADDLATRWLTPAAEPSRIAGIVATFRALPAAGYAQMCRALADLELAEDATRIDAPALVVNGTADVAVSPDQAEEYGRLLPNADRLAIEGAPHLLPIECASELARLLVDRLPAAA